MSSLKVIGLLHFWGILGPIEKVYNLQSLWITLYYLSPTINQVILCECQRFSTIFKGCLNHAISELQYLSLDEKTFFRGTEDAEVKRMSTNIGCILVKCENKRDPNRPFISIQAYLSS